MTGRALFVGTLAFSLACAGGGGGGGGAAGAVPSSAADLEHSRWAYEDLSGADDESWEFDPSGSLYLPSGNNPVPDTWTFDGTTLTAKINDYATYEGRITAQGAFIGTAKNTKGETWEWTLVPEVPPAKDGCGDGSAFDLTDSKWVEYEDGGARSDDTVFFLPNGRFTYRGDTYNTNNSAPDTWTQAGQDVTWSVNQYANYTGRLVGDHTIVASVKNTEGKTWRVRLLRVPVPGECP